MDEALVRTTETRAPSFDLPDFRSVAMIDGVSHASLPCGGVHAFSLNAYSLLIQCASSEYFVEE